MDDASGVDVTKCTKHATEIGFDAGHGEFAIIVLRRVRSVSDEPG
jgi:hypothetical protein